jgi:signal transduction histidine kinase/CheY-like chemotaxis protein
MRVYKEGSPLILERSHKASLPLVLCFVFLLLCAASAMWLSWKQKSADGWVRHTLEVENRLSQVQILTMRADIHRRGFLITGSPRNVRTYYTVREDVLPALAALETAVSDNPAQQHRARLLRARVAAKFDEMESSIRLSQADQKSDAAMMVGGPSSQARTLRMTRLFDLMRQAETRLLAQRRARSDHLDAFATGSLGLSALLILCLALFVSRERGFRLVALGDANRLLELDVAKRMALEDELNGARERAEAAVAAKSSFLANMSHEIRTPMNGVIGFTELLLASDLSDQQRRQGELIADSGRAMMRLLNDILDLSKVEAGQMTIAEEPFDLPHALGACAKLMSPTMVQRGLAFRLELDPALPKLVVGDGLRLRQIVLNLLGNASKFTLEGGVTIRAAVVDGADRQDLVISVQDSGIGIAPEKLSAVFDHFVQAEAGTAGRFGGTGLGLSISAQLARLMGGDLTVESTFAEGSTFILTLPLKLAEDAPVAAVAPLAPRDDEPREGVRVLVAEDHDVNQLLIVAMLDQLGYQSDLAKDGEAAIAMAEQARARGTEYSVVLMDLQMPGADGYEATRRLRASGFTGATLPIIALSANAYADDIATCLEAGMQAHLAKPVKLPELDRALRRWAARPAVAPKKSLSIPVSPQLRERYAARKQEMLLMVDQMVRDARFDDAGVSELGDALHKFAGSAAYFGDAELGELARLLEQGLAVWTEIERCENVPIAAAGIKRAA